MKKPLKKKFYEVELPLINETIKVLAYLPEEALNRMMRIDMTRKLRGKSLDLIFKIQGEKNKLIGYPKKLKLMLYFIQHMLRKRASYVEDSITTDSKESKIIIKPFLITRKKVSRAVRKTLRNSARNWLIDYVKEKENNDLFERILSGDLQKELNIKLKKIYPLSLCEIRIFEIKDSLKTEKQEKKEQES